MSRSLYIPEGYAPKLNLRETQHAIKYIKDVFQQALSFALTLDRVTAPLIVEKGSGINDDLNGVERKVDFDIKEINGKEAEVVQSLAKWKRMALYRYGYQPGEGIYTDMNAIRRDDDTDNLHSIFVDQWDWEKVITRSERTMDYLRDTVRSIVKAIVYTKRKVQLRYPVLKQEIVESPPVHHIGRSGSEVSGSDTERAGKCDLRGSRHRVHHANRRQNVQRGTP